MKVRKKNRGKFNNIIDDYGFEKTPLSKIDSNNKNIIEFKIQQGIKNNMLLSK
jgi:hypothetical protein